MKEPVQWKLSLAIFNRTFECKNALPNNTSIFRCKVFFIKKIKFCFVLFVWDLRLNIKRLLTIWLFPYLLQASWDEREFCFSLSFIHRLIIIINISDNQTSKVMVICTITSIHTYIEHPDKTNAHRVNAHSANSILWVIHGVKSAD